MAGESGKGCKGIIYHYYKCSGAKRRLGCKKKAIKKNWIEETVVTLTVTKVLTDEAISRIADAIVIMQEQEDTMTPVLKQQLRECEAAIRNVMKAIQQGIITESTKECLEDLEAQKDSLKASILQLQLERRKFTKEEIIDWISKYKYGNINDLDYRKEIIDTFVNSVYVYDDKLVLTYNYKDGTETLTLQEIESALSSNLTSMCPPRKEKLELCVRVFCFYGAGTGKSNTTCRESLNAPGRIPLIPRIPSLKYICPRQSIQKGVVFFGNCGVLFSLTLCRKNGKVIKTKRTR